MNREDCWMTFTEALEKYLNARVEKNSAPEGCRRYVSACEDMKEASEHMDALTSLPNESTAVASRSLGPSPGGIG